VGWKEGLTRKQTAMTGTRTREKTMRGGQQRHDNKNNENDDYDRTTRTRTRQRPGRRWEEEDNNNGKDQTTGKRTNTNDGCSAPTPTAVQGGPWVLWMTMKRMVRMKNDDDERRRGQNK
jgi:hypothetical protein